jgi:hypothetical protein
MEHSGNYIYHLLCIFPHGVFIGSVRLAVIISLKSINRLVFVTETFVGPEVLIFWDMTQRSPLKVNRRFGGKYRLHLASCWFIVWLTLQALGWREVVPLTEGSLSTDYTVLHPRRQYSFSEAVCFLAS